eukprot:393412-Hanusia_phi.AAC.1
MRLSDYSFGQSITAASNKLGLSGLHYRHWLSRQSSKGFCNRSVAFLTQTVKDLNRLRYIFGIHDGFVGLGS